MKSLGERDLTVQTLTKLGLSATEIGERLHISGRTVVRIRVRLGISMAPVDAYGAELHERARALLDDGASAAEVGRTLHVSGGTVRKWFPGMAWDRQQVSEWANFQRQYVHGLEKKEAAP